jgi:RNA polymerase sigma-70 factor (ECF subfamily)
MDPSMPSAEVLLEHAEFLRRLARGILHDADAADDVAQEAMVAGLVERPRNLRAWLGKVARHLALSRRRAEARRELREHAAAGPEALPSAAEGVARIELQRQVVDAVLALDEPYRSVVVHRFFYELTPTEIAKRLHVPLETVRTRLRRAIEQLRARLDATHGRRAWSVALLAIAVRRKTPLGGILVMSAKTKLALASVLVLAGAALGITALSRRNPTQPRAPMPHEEARAVEPEPTPAPDPLPPPVDPAAIDRDLDVHGLVVDAAGNAVAGAAVRVVRYPAMGVAIGLAQLEAVEGPGTRTASDGSFALRVERGEEVDLLELQRRWCPAGGRVRIVLRKGVSLRVAAKGPAGQPLSGAHAILFKGKEPEMEAAGVYVFLEGVTDAQGTCVLTDLLPGREVQVAAWHADFDDAKPAAVKLPDSGEAEVELTAGRGREVTGRVTDEGTGAPVAGATVNAYPMAAPFMKSVSTDADGRFKYGGWGSEPALFVHAKGYASARENVGDRTLVDFTLKPGVTVTGVVRDVLGAPVPGAFVGAYATDRTEIHETYTDADGRFQLPDLSRARVLVVAKPGFARTQQAIDAKEIEIVLGEGHRLEGRVLDADGKPLEGVEVDATPTSAVAAGAMPSGIPEHDERHTDDLGRFRFTDLPTGGCRVSATREGRRVDRPVTIEDRDVTDVELRFEAGREFGVVVVDDTGRPVPGVLVTCSSGRKTTDAQGRVTFEMARGAKMDQVFVSRFDARYARPPSLTYMLGQPEPRIILHEAASVSGRLLVDGQPFARARCRVTGADGFSDLGMTDQEGKFAFRVPAGTRVDVEVTGDVVRSTGEQEVQPIYGELKDVAAGTEGLVLEARRVANDRTLVVRVVTPAGKGVPGMQVLPEARGLHPAREGSWTDASGRVEFSGLPAAEIQVLLFFGVPAPWAQAKPNLVKVLPNGQEVVFRLREAKPIRGVVCGPDGAGVSAGLTAWRGEREVVATAHSEADGTFAIYVATDEPGAFRLEAWGAQGMHGNVEGVVPGAGAVTIQLRAE